MKKINKNKMKKNFKNYVLPIILAFGMLFTSCEKDLDENVIQQDSKAIIQRISLNEIEKLNLNDKLIETVNKIKNKKFEKLQGRLIYNPQFNFYIDDETGLYAEKDGVKSYTFQIFRENPTDKIENIVFNQKGDLFDVYVNKYNLPQADIDKIKREEPVNIDQSQVTSTLITSNRVTDCTWHVISIYSNGDGTCTIEWECTGSSGSGPNSSGDSGSLGTNSTTGSNSSSSTTNSGGTTTGNYDPIGNSSSPIYTTNTGTGSTTSGSGSNYSGNSTSPYSPPPPVVTTPIASPVSREEALLRNTFKNQLLPQQLTFFNSLSNAERSNFFNFLYVNSVPPEEVENVDFVITEYSSDAVTFAQNAIIRMIANPNLKIDLQKSFKSPAYIDTSSIANNTPEGAKFNDIYNSLMTSPKFKEMFNRMFGVVNFINVKFNVAHIPQIYGGGYTSGLCSLSEYSNGMLTNNITIDKSKLLTKSKIETASVIIHELIHAFLNIKLRHPNIGMSIPNINNKDLECLLNENYNSILGNSSHDFMIEKLIPTMVQMLAEIKDDIFTPIQIANANNFPTTFIYQPMTSNPFGPDDIKLQFNWNDYFTNLCMRGLETTNYFITNFANPSVNYTYFYQYINLGNSLFNP